MSAWSGGQQHRLRYVGSLICRKALCVDGAVDGAVDVGVGVGVGVCM